MVPILQIAKLALQRGSCLQSHSKEFDCTKLENFHSKTHVLVTHLALENMINCIFAYATKRKKKNKEKQTMYKHIYMYFLMHQCRVVNQTSCSKHSSSLRMGITSSSFHFSVSPAFCLHSPQY